MRRKIAVDTTTRRQPCRNTNGDQQFSKDASYFHFRSRGSQRIFSVRKRYICSGVYSSYFIIRLPLVLKQTRKLRTQEVQELQNEKAAGFSGVARELRCLSLGL